MVVSGPSGVGKDTVVRELDGVYKRKEVGRELKFIVTATTRYILQTRPKSKLHCQTTTKE